MMKFFFNSVLLILLPLLRRVDHLHHIYDDVISICHYWHTSSQIDNCEHFCLLAYNAAYSVKSQGTCKLPLQGRRISQGRNQHDELRSSAKFLLAYNGLQDIMSLKTDLYTKCCHEVARNIVWICKRIDWTLATRNDN
jgi:hypothetical protein